MTRLSYPTWSLSAQSLANGKTTKLIHCAPFEREVLGRQGFVLDGVVDTREASIRLRRTASGHSLREVCARELGVELDKKEQTGDWTRRPLTESQVNYAARTPRYYSACTHTSRRSRTLLQLPAPKPDSCISPFHVSGAAGGHRGSGWGLGKVQPAKPPQPSLPLDFPPRPMIGPPSSNSASTTRRWMRTLMSGRRRLRDGSSKPSRAPQRPSPQPGLVRLTAVARQAALRRARGPRLRVLRAGRLRLDAVATSTPPSRRAPAAGRRA